jgi:hypothetical protein
VLGEAVAGTPQLTETVVVTVTVGSPSVPIAVWIGTGSEKVLLAVVEMDGAGEETEDAVVTEDVVVTEGAVVSVAVEDEEAESVEEAAAVLVDAFSVMVIKVILLN